MGLAEEITAKTNKIIEEKQKAEEAKKAADLLRLEEWKKEEVIRAQRDIKDNFSKPRKLIEDASLQGLRECNWSEYSRYYALELFRLLKEEGFDGYCKYYPSEHNYDPDGSWDSPECWVFTVKW